MACNKRAYFSESIAIDALIEARTRFESNTATTVYLCDDCGQWHLTSRGELHPDLARQIQDKNFNREKEAHHWQKKMK